MTIRAANGGGKRLNSPSRSSQVWAFYGQDEYSITRNLLLNAGIRHDHDSTFGGTTNPRLGLIYDPAEGTTLKFLYGTAFRAPNAYELYYQSSALELPNPMLQPETIHTMEFVVEQYMGVSYRMSGSVFQNKIDRLIDQVENPDGSLQFQNVGSVRTRGVQLVLNGIWASGRSAQVNYTYERPVNMHTGDVLHNAPAHLVNANLLIPFLSKRLTAGLDFHYAGSRRTVAGNEAPGFVVTNMMLSSSRFFGGFELSGSIYNLFDKQYGYLGGDEHREEVIYQDGRTARLKLTYTFGGSR
ncbi:MAG: TonB-dependent receptor [Acidobacteria bacterium]|nr:TonB-dependent receptor [Acidobacteriota bacterium]